MSSVSALCLFCDDIREEKSGQDTLIGILPDNVNIQELPVMLPKLGIYFRILIPIEANPRSIKTKVRLPTGQVLQMSSLDHIIEQSKNEARATKAPFSGLIAKGVMAPFPVQLQGRVEAIVEIDGEDIICGIINLKLVPPVITSTTSATASAQPASQSSAAAPASS